MSTKERRFSPRKGCTIPIRFRTFTSEYVPVGVHTAVGNQTKERMSSVWMTTDEEDIFGGEAINLSEHDISFKSEYKFRVGESVELFFTLPRELTGRRPEEVR